MVTRPADRPFLVLAWARDDAALRQALGAASTRFLLQTVRGGGTDGGLAEALGAMTAAAPPADAAGPLRHLTGQERRILDLIGEGHSNREIGARLHIAEKTVKNHVTRLLAKLGMTRRAQAAAFVARLTGPGGHGA